MESFAVIGMGRFGMTLARELYRLGHEVLAVDKDEEICRRVADSVSHAVAADARDEQTLISLGLRNFDHVAVAFAGNVFTESDMGARFAQTISAKNFVDYIDLSEDYSIAEAAAPDRWAGKTIRQLDVRAKYGVNILAVKTGGGGQIHVSPGPDYMVRRGDTLVVIGANDDIKELK